MLGRTPTVVRPFAFASPDMDTHPPPRGDRATGIRRTLATIALEILVGFVGVYAAFWLAARHERQEMEERRRQVRVALVEEIRDIKRGSGNAAVGFGRLLAFYDSAFKAGGRPALQPMLTSERFDTHIWNATQQSGGLMLLDVPTYMKLSAYYNELARGFAEIDGLRTRTETVLLPNIDKGPEEFYSAPGKIRLKYAWYPMGVKRLHDLAVDINGRSDSLIVLLQRKDAK
jgi:hypothetical protein